MRTTLLGLAWTCLLVSSAAGQYPGMGSGVGYPPPYSPAPLAMNTMPNFYNRQTQPLSPYLNLLRGGNPGVNYFYGVRPGLSSSGLPFNSPMSGVPFGGMPLRTGFLPAAASPTQEPLLLPIAGEPIESLPPSGRPVFFAGATAFGRPTPNTPNFSAARPGVLGNQAPSGYQSNPSRRR